MTRRFQFSFWARPMRAAWAFLVSGILVCGPTWFIYGWGRDTAFGYGAQVRDAGKIGVMAVICYEMLLIPSVAAVRLMFPRRQIDSPPPTLAHAISCWGGEEAWVHDSHPMLRPGHIPAARFSSLPCRHGYQRNAA